MLRKFLLLVWLAFALASPATAQTTPTGKFLHLSDIHFDPFADPTLVVQLSNAPVDQWEAILQTSSNQTPASGKKDSNYALLKSALTQAAQAGDYDYIVYTGDYLSHGFVDQPPLFIRDPAKQKAFAAQTVAFVNWMIAKYYPGKTLIATLGNNDSNCYDYRLTPGGDIMPGVEASLPVVANDPAALADFEAGGYYRTPHPTLANVDFLVLSIFWSDSWKNKCGTGSADPRAAQMQWLGKKLADAQQNGRRAIILMHIPPGMDAFSSYKARGPGKTMWTSDGKMLGQFQALASQYKAQLIDGFAGHTHMDEYRVIADTAPIMAIRMGPSVTPSNGNRPAFTVVNYDTTDGSATDYSVSSYDAINGWTAYSSFTTLYGFKRYSAANLQKLAELILGDPGTANDFAGRYATGNYTPASANTIYFGCALTALTPYDYASCVKPKSRKKVRN
jgi:hypothetical protein